MSILKHINSGGHVQDFLKISFLLQNNGLLLVFSQKNEINIIYFKSKKNPVFG